MTAGETLDALLQATPEPPASDADPGDVLSAAETMTSERAPHIERLAQILDGYDLDTRSRATLEMVCERDSRWSAALHRARHELSLRLGGHRHGY